MLENKILTDLRKNRGRIIRKDMVGMVLSILYKGEIYTVKVVDYISGKQPRFIIEHDGFVFKNGIQCNSFISGIFGNILKKNIEDRFKYCEEEKCWFGWTSNGDKFAFDGDDDTIRIITDNMWYVSNNRIYCSTLSKSLHQLVYYKKVEKNMVIDHISNSLNLKDKFYDNRIQNLREVTIADNNKNKKPKNNNGYTGLVCVNDRYYTSLMYSKDNIRTIVRTKLKDKSEGIIDNLISQRFLGYQHQEEEFYKLNELPFDRVKEVEDLLVLKINKGIIKKPNKNKKYDNSYTISDDKKDIICKDKNKNIFILNNENASIKILNEWRCYVVNDNGKSYVLCQNRNGETLQQHRLLMGLTNKNYSSWCVDHINGCGTDNRFENLVITNQHGNMCNVKSKGYKKKKNGKYEVSALINYIGEEMFEGKARKRTFDSEEEATKEVCRRKQYALDNRINFKNKEELDEFLEWCNKNNYEYNYGWSIYRKNRTLYTH